MGRVFLGASADGQLVAVKVIRADLAADPEFRARFRREVTVARKVSSRFTVPLIHADTDGAVPWLATAYVTGPSLADAVTEHGPLPVRSVLELTAGWPEPVTRTFLELPETGDPSRTVTSARSSPVSRPAAGRPGRHEGRRHRRRLARPLTIASMVVGLLAASAAGGLALAASAHQTPGMHSGQAVSGHMTSPTAAPRVAEPSGSAAPTPSAS